MTDVTVTVLDPSAELRLHRLTGAFLAGYRNVGEGVRQRLADEAEESLRRLVRPRLQHRDARKRDASC